MKKRHFIKSLLVLPFLPLTALAKPKYTEIWYSEVKIGECFVGLHALDSQGLCCRKISAGTTEYTHSSGAKRQRDFDLQKQNRQPDGRIDWKVVVLR
jgi:hypothetical protein